MWGWVEGKEEVVWLPIHSPGGRRRERGGTVNSGYALAECGRIVVGYLKGFSRFKIYLEPRGV